MVVGPRTAAEDLAVTLAERSFRHVMLVVGNGSGSGGAGEDPSFGEDPASTAALARHCALADLAFAAAQRSAGALQRGGSYTALLLDAFEGEVPRPYTAVFSGLVRSLEQELGECATFALFTDERMLGAGVAQLVAEAPNHRYLPLAYQRRGARLEQLLLPLDESAVAIAARRRASAAIPERPVVLATGGARGLTAHLVDQICADSAPRAIWLLGAGPAPDPAAVPPEVPRAEALRALMAAHPGENLARLNKRYEASLHQGERATTMRRLAAQVGASHVHYRQCDVMDAAAVRAVVDEILAIEGQVDVVLHGAGLVRSAQLARKKLEDLRAVRDVKVLGYAHLRAAFGARQPALWCNLSSVSAFMGRLGEPDYCAGNEYLLLTAAAQRASRGRDEVALVSALWVESGMASADTVGGAFLARQGDIGQLTDRQGRDFYAAELRGRGSHELGTTWIGDSDWATLERKAPGLRAACRAEASRAEPRALAASAATSSAASTTSTTSARSPTSARDSAATPRQLAFLHGARKLEGRGEHLASWLCELDLVRHSYLLDHLVDDRPTLPGTFILELAAEAAYELAAAHGAPSLCPVKLTDISLSRFIRAPRDRWPRRLLVTAERRPVDAAHRGAVVVSVRVSTPAQGPVAELEHARIDVHLAPRRALVGPRPSIDPALRPSPSTGISSSDPYHLAGASVALGGVFPALAEAQLLPDGGAATLSLAMPRSSDDAVRWESFLLPSVALDAMLRTIALDGRTPDSIDVLVPTAIAEVTLHTAANDRELATRFPTGIALRHQINAAGEHAHAALSSTGELLLSASGVAGAVRATWEPALGRWRAPTTKPASISSTPAAATARPVLPGAIAQ
jgi:predicted flap endonuclease-1-like 5' DNA nuclease